MINCLFLIVQFWLLIESDACFHELFFVFLTTWLCNFHRKSEWRLFSKKLRWRAHCVGWCASHGHMLGSGAVSRPAEKYDSYDFWRLHFNSESFKLYTIFLHCLIIYSCSTCSYNKNIFASEKLCRLNIRVVLMVSSRRAQYIS